MATFPSPGAISAFSDRLVARDLPDLPDERRAAVVAFVGHRVATLPTPMRLGVGMVALAVAAAGRLIGPDRVTGLLAAHPLPVLGEYVRLVRSLAYAYVWENWPATAAAGAPLVVTA